MVHGQIFLKGNESGGRGGGGRWAETFSISFFKG